MKDPEAYQNVLLAPFSKAPLESNTIFDENGRIREAACGGLDNGRKTWMVLECSTMGPLFSNEEEHQWVTGFWTGSSCRVLAFWT